MNFKHSWADGAVSPGTSSLGLLSVIMVIDSGIDRFNLPPIFSLSFKGKVKESEGKINLLIPIIR